MKVLLADALPDAAVERLEAAGAEVTRLPDLTADTLPGESGGHEVLIVRSTKVTAETLDAEIEAIRARYVEVLGH